MRDSHKCDCPVFNRVGRLELLGKNWRKGSDAKFWAERRSRPQVKRKICDKSGKKWFQNEVNALLAIVKIRENRKSDSTRQRAVPDRAYKCPFCDGWHLTSKPKRM